MGHNSASIEPEAQIDIVLRVIVFQIIFITNRSLSLTVSPTRCLV